ncbi:alpha/beta hydrolase [Georgenia sp. Z1491]|uniref:alpha/beta hydrolase n=1 Tax=Georgenia sp. Z1491 TaxID=3416707 RepID=UPI003CF7C929
MDFFRLGRDPSGSRASEDPDRADTHSTANTAVEEDAAPDASGRKVRTGVGPAARSYLLEADLPPLDDPSPPGEWVPDLLGAGFHARTLPLPADEEGQVVATLVAYRPAEDPDALPGTPATATWAMLYLHGWNDYVHNVGLARRVAALGGAFYGLDLRKYGRSLRPHQSRGYVDSLSVYDDDLHAARDVIFDELGLGTDLVLGGHSTGGLTAALWAHRHPGALRGLVLNSPFISAGMPGFVGAATTPVIERIARTSPKTVVRVSPVDLYQRTLDGVAEGDDEVVPSDEAEDRFWTGWKPDRRWRMAPAGPVRFGWLAAILTGQRQVAGGLDISCPVLVLTSARSAQAVRWSPDLRFVDTVLDVAAIRSAALRLGPHVTLAAFDGAIHDVMLSAPKVRRNVYDELGRWVRAYVLR